MGFDREKIGMQFDYLSGDKPIESDWSDIVTAVNKGPKNVSDQEAEDGILTLIGYARDGIDYIANTFPGKREYSGMEVDDAASLMLFVETAFVSHLRNSGSLDVVLAVAVIEKSNVIEKAISFAFSSGFAAGRMVKSTETDK